MIYIKDIRLDGPNARWKATGLYAFRPEMGGLTQDWVDRLERGEIVERNGALWQKMAEPRKEKAVTL